MIELGHGTHVGLRRADNEDTYQADAELGLWLVADGMGGADFGEVAAALARDTITREVRAGRSLVDAIRAADQAIIEQPDDGRGRLPMGTTVAALRVLGNNYQVAWVGDSRVYRADHSLCQLSRDHSVVRRLVDMGAITEDEARRHPRRNEITQALGITPADFLQVSSVEGRLQEGSQFLLCSDGLTEELDDATIEALVMRRDISAQECVDQLLAAALQSGGKDNITVLLLRVGAVLGD